MENDLLTSAAAINRRINGLVSFCTELPHFIVAIRDYVLLDDVDANCDEVKRRVGIGIRALNTLHCHLVFLEASGILAGVEASLANGRPTGDFSLLLERLNAVLPANAKARLIWDLFTAVRFRLYQAIAKQFPPTDNRAVAHVGNVFRAAAWSTSLVATLDESDFDLAESVLAQYEDAQRRFVTKLPTLVSSTHTRLWIGPAINAAELAGTLAIALAIREHDESEAIKGLESLQDLWHFLTSPRLRNDRGFGTFFYVNDAACLSEIAWRLQRADVAQVDDMVFIFEEPTIRSRRHLAALPDRLEFFVTRKEIRSYSEAQYTDDPVQFFRKRQFCESDYCARILPVLIQRATEIGREIRAATALRQACEVFLALKESAVARATTKAGAYIVAFAILQTVERALSQPLGNLERGAAAVALTEFIDAVVRGLPPKAAVHRRG